MTLIPSPWRRLTGNPVRYAIAATLACALLQGCGGGAETVQTGGVETPSTPSPTPPASNHAPTLTGTPAVVAQASQAYSFQPVAADSDGDTLTFSIANKPAWADFDTATGQLSGTPSASQTGQFSGVTISVSDGIATASLAAFAISVSAAPAGTGSATVSWTPPTAREDGTSLTNLASYNIRYGTSPGVYTQTVSVSNISVTSKQIDNLSTGTYYFVVTAVDAAGYESKYSEPATKTIG